ncbi:deiodinase-like protein [Flagellimonas sp. S3867]|uniref:deiodinase-like protein n=1 Tax=Flagellimonas sp. S3867 TaxID=2768063 RepID=UPI001CC23E3F|nr:deiodinase-like protein [Flagellimonas sp. S3867]
MVIETGSNTCPMYVKCVPKMEIFREMCPEVNFLMVYVREAHPGERVKSHESLTDKIIEVRKVQKLYNDNRTVLVDSIDGLFHKTYGSHPNMVYVINAEGIVLFRGDWNNISKLKKVLNSINDNKIYTEEHFEPTKPNPAVAIKALTHGGAIAVWILLKEFLGL